MRPALRGGKEAGANGTSEMEDFSSGSPLRKKPDEIPREGDFEIEKRPGKGVRWMIVWLRIAESWRTIYSENPEAFDVDEEFFRLNPTVSREEFEAMLLE
jgi:hypothetical protein